MPGRLSILSVLCVLLLVAPVAAQPLPLGATVNRSGSTITGVTFRVWAPNATSVALRGDFNGWGETAMTKDNATGYWSATVAAARPGQEYKYFLRWNGNTGGSWRQDPRAAWVRGGNSVIYDHAAFDWGATARPSIPVDQQVMYELHIGSFHDPDPNDDRPGTFDDAIARLGYLERLGVNVIALMPVNEFGGDYSWGYNPEHVFAIESAYGGPDGLKRFVKAAHQRGMKVQLDVVHNHWNPPSDGLWDFDGPANIYFYTDGRGWTPWGSRPNYDQAEVRRYIQENIKTLLDDFRVDGFRWDSPQNILAYDTTKSGPNPNTVLPNGKSMMMAINRMIHVEYPDARWSIAEDADLLTVRPGGSWYPTDSIWYQLRVDAAADSYDGHWQTSFHNEITPQIASSAPFVETILSKVNGWSEPPGYRVIFTDNHDKSGILNDNTRLANRMDPLNPSGRTARKKTLLNAVLTLTAPGTPMLWMGQEFHATGPFSDRQAFDWRTAAGQHRIFRAHRDLVALRETLPALQNSDLSTASGGLNEDLDLVVYFRRSGEQASNDVVVFFNFSGQTRNNINVPFPSSGAWHVRLNTDWPVYGTDFNNIGPGGTISVGVNGRAELSIGPHSAIIFARSPAPAGTTLDDADGDGIPDGWEAMSGAAEPDADADNDGITNLGEYQLGFDPNVPDPTNVAGTFNGWNPSAAPMRAAGNADEVHFLYWSPEARAETAKFIFAGEWYGLAGQPNLGSEDNIPFTAPAGGYVRLSFNTRTKTPSVMTIGTTPGAMIDADNDGMDDRWERFHGVSGPASDPDNDGFGNLQEFRRGSDPNAWNRPFMALAGQFNGWNVSGTPLVFSGNTRWAVDLLFPAGSAGEFKFTDGTWTNTWGERRQDGSQANISRAFERGGIYRFVFEEADSSWSIALEEADADSDGIPDAWVSYYGLSGAAAVAGADPDGDGITNLGEFRRLSSPLVLDRMSLVGSLGPLSWSPDDTSSRMAWSESRGRWEWTGALPQGVLDFKFASGPGWNGTNYGPGQVPGTVSAGAGGNLQVTLAAARYRFFLDEITGLYGLEVFPVSAEWREFHHLPGPPDWSADTDGDGAPDLFEFALGGNPVDKTDGPALQLFSPTNISGVDRLVWQWLERTDAGPSLVVTPVFSSDLVAGWQPLTASNVPARAGDPARHQRKEVSVPIDGTAGFLRLRVSGP